MSEIQERLQAQLADRYQFERELGRGGMATVYLARDVRHDREVAIKVLDPDIAASIGGDRFEREIKLAAKLQHPHILGLYDSGSADGLLFYVMPFVKGESLRDRLDREGQLPIEDALQIVLEVADALGHAHTHNIVHRDIKPENILLSNGHALVADFGIAKAAAEGTAQKLTQTGMAVGTPVYMSPEQSSGDVVGPTADLYSLGCMLYEMLAGEPPFTAKSAMALMARHAMESVPSIRIVRQTVPEEIEDAIFAAMAKVPADRPQTAAQFSEMLGAGFGMGTTTARRAAIRATATRRVPTGANVQYQGEAPWYKKPWAIAAAAVVLIGAGLATWQFGFAGASEPAAGATGLDPHNVAVLYFEDVSRDKQLGFVAEGLTEGLIKTLAQVQGLKVISKGGVNAWRGVAVGADSVARALQAGTLVRGSIEQEGDKIRVNVRLVDGNSGADIERAAIEQPAVALLGVQDSVAERVAVLIRKRLGEEIRLQQQRSRTNDVGAWSLVQQAEQLRKSGEAASAREDTLALDRDFRAADSLLALAEAADPKWADPIVLRGLVAYRRSRLANLDPTVIQRWIKVGLDHENRALAMDPTDPNALEIRGNLKYWSLLMGLEPDAAKAQALLQEAKEDLETATRINPVQAGAWASLSHLYYAAGSVVDVNMAAKRALEADAFLDNAIAILNRLFESSYDLEQFTDAAHWCDETKRRFPESSYAASCELFLLTTRAREPDVDLAFRLADSVTVLTPGPRQEITRLQSQLLAAGVAARAGLKDSARRVIERSKGNAEIDPTRDLALIGAFAYALIGDNEDKDKAIELLKLYILANERFRDGFRNEVGWQFRSLQDRPSFSQLKGAN